MKASKEEEYKSATSTVKAKKGTTATTSMRERKLTSALTDMKKPKRSHDRSQPAKSATHASQMAQEVDRGQTAFNAYLVKSIRDPSNYYFRHPEAVDGVLGKPKDKLINRQHKLKNSFLSVFPSYGLLKQGSQFQTSKQDMDKRVQEAPPVVREHFRKWDNFKAY